MDDEKLKALWEELQFEPWAELISVLRKENEALRAKVEMWKDIAKKNGEAGVKYVDAMLLWRGKNEF